MQSPSSGAHDVRWAAKVTLGLTLAGVVLIRAVGVVQALRRGDESPLLAFPLTVIFPALLVIALAAMPPALSREGALMRVGTMIQCLAIAALPGLALHLALGLPVVFLAVELFETRCPSSIRAAISRQVVT